MSTCWDCGEEIVFRYVDGVLKRIHVNGGWCQGGGSKSESRTVTNINFDDYCRKTTCPECGEEVYFIRHNGGSVWVDALGWPWPKHPCMDSTPEPSWYQYFHKVEPQSENADESLFSGVVIESIRKSEEDLNSSRIILAIDGGPQGRVVLSTNANTTANYLKGEIVIVNLRKMKITFSNHRVNDVFEIGINPEILGLPANWSSVS